MAMKRCVDGVGNSFGGAHAFLGNVIAQRFFAQFAKLSVLFPKIKKGLVIRGCGAPDDAPSTK